MFSGDSSKFVTETKPIIEINKIYDVDGSKVPVKIQVDATNLPKEKHEDALLLAKTFL